VAAVVFFYLHLLSPTASIFRSGAPYAARTFLSQRLLPAAEPGHCFQHKITIFSLNTNPLKGKCYTQIKKIIT